MGLTGMALCQPMVDLIGRSPTLFTFWNVTGWRAWLVVVGVAVGPGVLAWLAVEAIGSMSERAGRWTHVGVMGALAGLVVVQLLKSPLGAGWLLALCGLLVALAFGVGLVRFRPLASWARILAVLVPVSLVAFAFSESGEVLRAGPPDAVELAEAAEAPSVIMIVFDEWPTRSILSPSGDIDPVRFPNLAALADTSTWYPNATTMAATTKAAVPSILTGQDPVLEEATYVNHPDNLFTLLEPTHRLTVFESVTELCGSPRCGELPGTGAKADGTGAETRLGDMVGEVISLAGDRLDPFTEPEVRFDQFLESGLGEAVPDTDGIPRIATIETFASSFRPHTEPVLYFMHLVLPHSPWLTYADGEGYKPPEDDVLIPQGNTRGEAVAALSEQRHLLQAQYTDQLLGGVFDAARASGDYDDSLIVITADHGNSFELDWPIRDMEAPMFDEVAFVPLLIKEPGQTEGRVDRSNTYVTDIVPTIADHLDLELGWDVDGAPLGSDEVVARDSTKYAFRMPLDDAGQRTYDGRVEFDMVADAPKAANRWIAPISADDGQLAALHRWNGTEQYLGADVNELIGAEGDGGQVIEARMPLAPNLDVDRFRDFGSPGVMQGEIKSDAPEVERVLVALGGEVVSGAPVERAGEAERGFSVMLPPGSWAREEAFTLLAVTDDGEFVPIRAEER